LQVACGRLTDENLAWQIGSNLANLFKECFPEVFVLCASSHFNCLWHSAFIGECLLLPRPSSYVAGADAHLYANPDEKITWH
jgi:hypothetical protein